MVRRYQPKRIFFSSSVLEAREQQGQSYRSMATARRFFAAVEPYLTLVHTDEWQQIYLYRSATGQ